MADSDRARGRRLWGAIGRREMCSAAAFTSAAAVVAGEVEEGVEAGGRESDIRVLGDLILSVSSVVGWTQFTWAH